MIGLIALLTASVSSPEAVVQRQVEAFNGEDAGAFAATYAPEAEIYLHPGKLWMKGRTAIEAEYSKMFAAHDVTVRISHRSVVGSLVIDEERQQIAGQEHCCVVAVYHVAGGMIDRVDLIAPAPNPKAEKSNG